MFGAVYLFGGHADSPAFLLMAQVLPIQMWGALMVSAGVVLEARKNTAGGIVGAALWSVVSLTAVWSLMAHTAQVAGGWVLPIGIVVLHVLIVYGAATETRGG